MVFPRGPPFLAVITEPDACDSDPSMERTFHALSQAVSTGHVDLISLRQAVPAKAEKQKEVAHRLLQLAQRLMGLSLKFGFRVVISSDWIDEVYMPTTRTHATCCCVHGIHVKESHRAQIPALRQCDANILIGTSAHSVESAVNAWQTYQPDYFFVGTCYPTQTHPEKTAQDLEGPALPGQVVQALQNFANVTNPRNQRPPVLAIGGIHPGNCHEPVVQFGADGVAAIRAVLQSPDPAQTVQNMKQNIKAAL